MQKRHIDRKVYFEELAHTSEKYFIPYLEKHVGKLEHIRILEIGCGDGGNLLPFIKRGCEVTGIDICAARIEQATLFFQDLGLSPTLICSDIFKLEDIGTFDIVFVHDVIEHISDKENFLTYIERFISPQGFLYMGFPAWQMPFGGHHQICQNRILSKTPFLHLLPASWYRKILQWGGEEESTIYELLDIKKCGLTIERFNKLIKEGGYAPVHKEFYFINPHYEIKFNLPPIRLTSPFNRLPYIRNFYTTSCFYLLKKKSPDKRALVS